MFTVSAEPTQAFVDAFSARLKADSDTNQATSLISLLGGTMNVYGHLSEAARTAYPIVVLGRSALDRNAGAMGCAGGHVSLQIDTWSDYKGRLETSLILSRISRLLERHPLVVPGFEMVVGSLTCELSEISDEPDADKPEERLYHGFQQWVAEIHEAV